MNLREAAQQVLDCARWVNDEQAIVPYEQMINLRIMLENVVQAEPVAWAVITKNGKLYKAASTKESAERKAQQQIDKLGAEWECSVVPLYTAPPKRKPLTDEGMWEVIGSLADTRLAGPLEKLIRATERAHGIGGEE